MNIVILGSGQTGNVAASILRECGHTISGFVDDNPDVIGTTSYGLPVLGDRSWLNGASFDAVCLGVGTVAPRKLLGGWLAEHEIPTINAIHPSAVISPEAIVGQNVIAGANVTLFVNPEIGDGCYIGPSVTVSHDTIVGANCLLSAGSTVGARCDIQDEVLLGMAAIVMPPAFATNARLTVGHNAIVGVGSTVIRDVAPNTTVIGTPAKPLEKKA